MAREISLRTSGGEMPAYEAVPGGSAEGRGAVIVLQEAFGVNDHIEDITRRLSDAGYHAVAPHLFHRSGGGTLPYDDLSGVFDHIAQLSDEGVLEDVDAVLAHLGRAGWRDRAIGTVGFCMGGRASLLVAIERPVGAAVTFYGGRIVKGYGDRVAALLDRIPRIQAPWLGLFGDLDESIPIEEVESIRSALKVASVPTEIVRYPDAGHGFHCDARKAYHRPSASDAWGRTLAWFEGHLSPPAVTSK